LPTRLIDVGSEDKDPRLVETLGEMGQYTTLSHCWGKAQPLTTTSATLEERLQGIPLTLLPQTFREAIHLTRKFQIQYLWIDSLCIIQDSRNDWEVESAKMDQIYRCSAVTIAATSAADGRDGCFVQKEKWRESVPFETHDAHGLPVTALVRSSQRDLHDIGHERIFPQEPLSCRAWVLQERLLSTRVLHYTACELVFECHTDLYCECGDFPFKRSFHNEQSGYQNLHPKDERGLLIAPDILRTALTKACIWSLTWLRDFTPSFPSKLLNFTLHSISNGLLLDRGEAFRFWRDIIKLYTVRCLTFDRDALPAISGLARLIQRRVLDTYLAGLWREDLHRELLWYKSSTPFHLPPEDYALLKSLPFEEISPTVLPYRSRRTTEFCPPTWSWASIRGAVSFDGMWTSDGELEDRAQILEASCALASTNPMGSVSGGHIVLKAPLTPIRLGFYEENVQNLLHRCRVGELVCGQDNGDQHQHAEDCTEWNGDEWASLDLPQEVETATALDRQSFWRLRLAIKRPPHIVEMVDYAGRWLLGTLADEISSSHSIIYHLLLKQSRRRNEACFERVGLFVKTVPTGVEYSRGQVSTVKII
jgi:Heterokaryon incompatibility protein (HET)